jgi:hypothetical protein
MTMITGPVTMGGRDAVEHLHAAQLDDRGQEHVDQTGGRQAGERGRDAPRSERRR